MAGRRRLAVGDMLAPASFPRLGARGMVTWPQGTSAAVIFAPHPARCSACAGYLAVLGESAPGLKEWATRVMVLVSGPDAVADAAALSAAAEAGVIVLSDADGTGRAKLGAADGQAVVLQADRYGAVFEAEAVATADGDHATLPAAAALVSLAQYIDIQCPECSIPSREWLSATPYPLG